MGLTPEEQTELADLRAAFKANGGRGVEDAERIDELTRKLNGEPEAEYGDQFGNSDAERAAAEALARMSRKFSTDADLYGPMDLPALAASLIPSTPPTADGHALELHEPKARAAHEAAREARLAGETHYVWLDRRIEGFVVPRSDPNVYERPADLLFDNADDAQAWRDDEILDAEDCHDDDKLAYIKRWVLCRRDITVIS